MAMYRTAGSHMSLIEFIEDNKKSPIAMQSEITNTSAE
jgi:hypothetical protein